MSCLPLIYSSQHLVSGSNSSACGSSENAVSTTVSAPHAIIPWGIVALLMPQTLSSAYFVQIVFVSKFKFIIVYWQHMVYHDTFVLFQLPAISSLSVLAVGNTST